MTLEMPCAMDSSSSASAESWAASRRKASTRDMAPGGERRGRWGARDGKPPGPASTAQSAIKTDCARERDRNHKRAVRRRERCTRDQSQENQGERGAPSGG